MWVGVVMEQTITSPVSVTRPVSALETAVLTTLKHVKLDQHLVKADVMRNTTLTTSATATPSVPSTKTAAATTQTSVTVTEEEEEEEVEVV